MAKRKIHVDPYTRNRLGKVERVAESTGGFYKNVQVNEKYLIHLDMARANKINIKRYMKTHPDALSNARLTFLIPNEYWRENPDKCDVLGLDAKDAPKVNELPRRGIPGQVVKYHGKNYIAGEDGTFKSIQPKITEFGKDVVDLGSRHALTDENLKDYFSKHEKAKPYELEKYFDASSKKEIQDALDKLHREKIIRKDKNGWYRSKGKKKEPRQGTKKGPTEKEFEALRDEWLLHKSPEEMESEMLGMKMNDVRKIMKEWNLHPSGNTKDDLINAAVAYVKRMRGLSKLGQYQHDPRPKRVQDIKEQVIELRKEFNALPPKEQVSLGSKGVDLLHEIGFLESEYQSYLWDRKKKIPDAILKEASKQMPVLSKKKRRSNFPLGAEEEFIELAEKLQKKQEMRWFSLDEKQLRQEFKKYSDVESLKLAGHFILKPSERRLQKREKIENLILERIKEDKAIFSYGQGPVTSSSEAMPQETVKFSWPGSNASDFNDLKFSELTPKEQEIIMRRSEFDVDPHAAFIMKTVKGNKRLFIRFLDTDGKIKDRVVFDRRYELHVNQDPAWKKNLEKKGFKTMKKEVPDSLMKGFKEASKHQLHEYSIALDFERYLQQPERVVLLKGGESETIKIDDFELYGHTHPLRDEPRPSKSDINNLRPLYPEFIIAGNTGKTAFFNIQDVNKHEEWKKTHQTFSANQTPISQGDIIIHLSHKSPAFSKKASEITPWNYHETVLGRKIFEEITGVKYIPYKRKLTVEFLDEQHPYKKVPTLPYSSMVKYQKKE